MADWKVVEPAPLVEVLELLAAAALLPVAVVPCLVALPAVSTRVVALDELALVVEAEMLR